MSSEEQRRASRENGALSRGPKTAEGKRRSSQNAVRHGILARTIVLDEEDEEAFKAFVRALQKEMAPRTENEAAMIETAAASRWRLMRVWAMEREALRLEMGKYDEAEHAPAERATLAFRSLSEETRMLDVLHRYEVRYNRQYIGALREFVALRGKAPMGAWEGGPVQERQARHGTFRSWKREDCAGEAGRERSPDGPPEPE